MLHDLQGGLRYYFTWGLIFLATLAVLDVILTLRKVDLSRFYRRVEEVNEKAKRAASEPMMDFVFKFWSVVFMLWRLILWPILALHWMMTISDGETFTLKTMKKIEREEDKTKES